MEKDEAQSLGEILNGPLTSELLDEPSVMTSRFPGEAEPPPDPLPLSELDQQILKLKVAKDENVQQGKDIDALLMDLRITKRTQLVGKIDELSRELGEIDAALGREPQSAANGQKRGSKQRHAFLQRGDTVPGSQTERALNVLKAAPSKEFSAKELSASAGVPSGNVQGCLSTHVKNGTVRKRKLPGGVWGATRWSWVGKA